jgi:hypothetical protein
MRSRGGRAGPSSALDFLATIRAKERMPGGAAAFAVLDDDDRATLETLLRSYHEKGLTSALERQARTFLISYREIDKHAGVLDAAERARLDQILDEPPGRPAARHARRGPGKGWDFLPAVLIVSLVLGLRAALPGHVVPDQSGPPRAGAGQQALAGQVPPGPAELQKVTQDLGPWRQLVPSGLSPVMGTEPGTASPAVLLLLRDEHHDDNYFASGQWTISPDAPGWRPVLGGNIAAVGVDGDYAGFIDMDGAAWIAGVNQPFILSTHPGQVWLITRAGAVFSMSLAHATAVRRPLRK